MLGPTKTFMPSATFHYELIGLIPHAIDTTRKQDAFACWTVSRSVRVLSDYCHDDSGPFAPKYAVGLRLSSAAETVCLLVHFPLALVYTLMTPLEVPILELAAITMIITPSTVHEATQSTC